MSNESAPIRDAPAPFSGVPDPDSNGRLSDFILRSSDGVDFHVHREILKFSSDFYDDMFAVPGGDGDPNELQRDGKPVLLMPEPEVVLLRLLCLAYPGDTVAIYALDQEDLDTFVSVYKTAQKYQFFRVQRMLKEMLDKSALLDSQPHRVFALAWLCDLPELSQKAALSTLKSPLFDNTPSFPEMKLLSWQDSYPLYQFHHLCGQKAGEIAVCAMADRPNTTEWLLNEDTDKIFVWWKYYTHSSQCDLNCREYWTYRGESIRTGSKAPAPVRWFTNHLARVAGQLRLSPSRATAEKEVHNVASVERLILQKCPGCSEGLETDLVHLARRLAEKIDVSNKRLAEETFR